MLYSDQRYMYQNWGRFLTPDPSDANIRLANPTSWNRYLYVNGDPANSRDPKGLEDDSDDSGGGDDSGLGLGDDQSAGGGGNGGNSGNDGSSNGSNGGGTCADSGPGLPVCGVIGTSLVTTTAPTDPATLPTYNPNDPTFYTGDFEFDPPPLPSVGPHHQ